VGKGGGGLEILGNPGSGKRKFFFALGSPPPPVFEVFRTLILFGRVRVNKFVFG